MIQYVVCRIMSWNWSGWGELAKRVPRRAVGTATEESSGLRSNFERVY